MRRRFQCSIKLSRLHDSFATTKLILSNDYNLLPKKLHVKVTTQSLFDQRQYGYWRQPNLDMFDQQSLETWYPKLLPAAREYLWKVRCSHAWRNLATFTNCLNPAWWRRSWREIYQTYHAIWQWSGQTPGLFATYSMTRYEGFVGFPGGRSCVSLRCGLLLFTDPFQLPTPSARIQKLWPCRWIGCTRGAIFLSTSRTEELEPKLYTFHWGSYG